MSFCIKVLFLLIFQQFTTSHAKYRLGKDIDPCLELHTSFENLEQALTCCDAMEKAFEPIFAFESCLDVDPEIWSCRKFRCMFSAGADILIKKKEVNPEKGLEMLAKITKKYPELATMTNRMGHECFVKNLTQFYNYDSDCPSVNLMYCLVMHSFADCPSWNSSGDCQTLAEGAKLCKPRMDEYDRISERLHTAQPSTTTELTTVQEEYDPSHKSCGAVHIKYRNLELTKECCPAMKKIFEPLESEECSDITPRKWTCQKFRCLLHFGPRLLISKKEIDLKRGRQMLDDISKSNPELTQLTELLEHECFVKNVSRFYYLEDCPAMNLVYCFASNLLAECPKWKDDKKCKPLATPAKNCKAYLDFFRKISDNIHSDLHSPTTTISPELTVPTEEPTFTTCDSINTDFNLLENTRKCCAGMNKLFELIEVNRDCFLITPGKWSCKKSRCFLGSEIPDLLIETRDVNMTKARNLLHEITEQHPDMEHMARIIEHECIDKDSSRYYPVGSDCPALSFHNCWALNSFTECPLWSNNPECKDIKVWSKKCHDVMEQVRRKTDVIEHGFAASVFTLIYPDTLTSPMPKNLLCSELISDYTYVSAAEYCCFPMRKIFMKTLHVDKNCLSVTPGRWSCKKARCLLSEVPNLLVDDWEINQERGKEFLEEIATKYPNTKAMTKMMYRECIEKNVTRFYPVEMCPALNVMYCFLVNSFAECTNWNTEQNCDKVERKAKKCKRALDKVRVVTDDLHDKSTPKKKIHSATDGKTTRGSGGETDSEGNTVTGLDAWTSRGTGKVTGRETVPGETIDEDSLTETKKRKITKATATSPYESTPVDFSKPKCTDLHADYSNVELAKYCCDAMDKVLEPLSVNEGCLVISPHEWSCQKTQCLMSAVNGLLVDGTINVEAGHEMLENISKKYPELRPMTKIMDHECFVKSVTQFYPMGDCPANNLMYCLVVNSFAECPAWNEGGGCKDVTESAKNCKRTLGEVRKASDIIHEAEKRRRTTTTTEMTTTSRKPKDPHLSSCSKLLMSYETLELAKECCDLMKKAFEPLDRLEFCLDIEPEKWTCGKFRCFMSGVPNLLVNYRDVNPEGGRAMLDEITKKYPELGPMTKVMERECFVKNVSLYYPVNKCKPYQYMYCLAANSFSECTTWNDRPECKPLAEMSKSCKKFMDEERPFTDQLYEKQYTTTIQEETTMLQTTASPNQFALCTDLVAEYEKLSLAVQCCRAIDVLFESFITSDVCGLMPDEWSCMKARCYFLSIPGMLLKSKQVNKTAGHEVMRDIAEKHPDIAAMTKIIDHECFVKDADKFYTRDPKCPQLNMLNCILINSFAECPSWSDESDCQAIKESSRQCHKAAISEREKTDIISFGNRTKPPDQQITTTTATSTTKPRDVILCPDISTEFENLDSAKTCCDAMMKLLEPFSSNELCFDITPGNWTCGKARCFLEAAGILIESRHVSITAGLDLLKKLTENHPEMATMNQIIEHECFIKNASQFYSIDHKCPPQNLMYCIVVNSFAECTSWNKNPKCQPMKESSEQCKKSIIPERERTDMIQFGSTTKPPEQQTTTKLQEQDSRTITPPTVTVVPTITTTAAITQPVLPLCRDITAEYQNLDAATQCCDPMMKLFEPFLSNNLCLDISPDKWSCEKARCFGEAAGLLIDSRFVNEAAGRELLQKLAREHSEVAPMAKIIEDECFIKNASRFYPIDTKCPPLNVMFCIIVNSFAECPSWNDRPDCQPVKESSQKCKKVMKPIRKKTDEIHYGKKTTTTTKEITTMTDSDISSVLCPEIATVFQYFIEAKQCCETMSKLFDPFTDNMCFDIAPWGWTCGKARCFLSTAGLLIKSRFVNEVAGLELLNKLANEHPEMAPMTKIIERECFMKNSTRFYPFDAKCPPHNLLYCMLINSFSECPSWSNDDQCKTVADLSKQCKRRLDIVREQTDKIYSRIASTTKQSTTTTVTTPTPVTPVDFTKPQCPEIHDSFDTFELAKYCCVAMQNIFDEIMTTYRICLLLNSKNWACENFDCLFFSAQLLTKQYSIDYDSGRKWLQTVSQKYPEVAPMTNIMDHECFEKKVTRFYPINNCVSSSFMYCLAVNSYAECPKWKEDDKKCQQVIESSKKCKRSLVNARNESDFIHRVTTTQTPTKTTPLTTVKTTKVYVDDEYCIKVLEPNKLDLARECCTPMKKILQFLDKNDENEHCYDVEPHTWHSCVKLRCLMSEIPDLVNERDRTVNTDVGKQWLTEQATKYPEAEPMTKYMIRECYEKNYSRFYDVDKCQLLNNFYCLVENAFAECPSWSDDRKCQSIKELSQKCNQKLSDYRKITDKASITQKEIKPDPTDVCNIIHQSIKDLEQIKDCCDAMKKVFVPIENKACNAIEPLDQWSCQKMKCLLGTYEGLLINKSGINATVGNEMLAKVSKQHPSLESFINGLHKECFKNERLEDSKCPAFSLTHCLALNSFVDCPSWKNSEECKPYIDKAVECKAALEVAGQKKLNLLRNDGTPLIVYQPCMVVVSLYFAITM